MITDIEGLHHVTSMASDARATDRFFTGTLGLRRIKKTVNFDEPSVYHLYYGDGAGTPGTVMTYFPFPGMPRGRRGAGETSVTEFAVPPGALAFWKERFAQHGVAGEAETTGFRASRLTFAGPDGDGFALVEVEDDDRAPWTGADVPAKAAIRGFAGVRLTLNDGGPMADLLTHMGYTETAREGGLVRYEIEGGNPARHVDVAVDLDAPIARQGAGTVHHIAFGVADRAAQDRVRDALVTAGHSVTPVIDRDYFWAIYFRAPGGVLFEVATAEPGFARDEDPAHLGEGLMLPDQHAHLRAHLEERLPALD